MHKYFITGIFVLLLQVVMISAEAAEIYAVSAAAPIITVSVTGVGGESLWLGCSVKKGGKWIDLDAIKVTRNGEYQFMRVRGFDEYLVSLWRRKVSAAECKKINGKACEWCRKNGYHLDDQVSTTGWQHAPGAWGYK